jgi:hypothetical protein
MFGTEVTNETRADWAQTVIDTFTDMVGENGLQTDMGDLLCDLRHLADREGIDWATVLAHADFHYGYEVEED